MDQLYNMIPSRNSIDKFKYKEIIKYIQSLDENALISNLKYVNSNYYYCIPHNCLNKCIEHGEFDLANKIFDIHKTYNIYVDVKILRNILCVVYNEEYEIINMIKFKMSIILFEKIVSIFEIDKIQTKSNRLLHMAVRFRTTEFIKILVNKCYIEESKFNELIESIKLASGDNSKIKTVQWKYEISQVLGVLKVLLVDATIDSSTIKFVINGARVNQEIPIVYKTIQQCRPGSYLSCSRGTNCHVRSFNDCQDVDVPRGLTEDELSQIINSLNSKIPEIVKKITQ